MLAIQYANESRSDKKKNNRKTSLQGSLRQATVEIIFMKFHRTNEILKRNKMQVLFFLWYRNQKKKGGVPCPTHFVSIRQTRRHDDDDHPDSWPSQSRCRNYPSERPDRLCSQNKKKQTKWEQNAVHITCPGVDTFAGHKNKHEGGGKLQLHDSIATRQKWKLKKKKTTRRRWWFLWMTYYFCFWFTCRRLDRVTGVRFIDAHQAGLGTRWEVQSNRTVQRETQICDKHSNKKIKIFDFHT